MGQFVDAEVARDEGQPHMEIFNMDSVFITVLGKRTCLCPRDHGSVSGPTLL